MINTNEIEYAPGGIELLDDIAPLWGKLNQLHGTVSPHFREVFQKRTFLDRKEGLAAKSVGGGLRVDVARSNNGQDRVGYCVSTIDSEGIGEIDSIYVQEEYRCRGIASHFMIAALAWMDSLRVAKKRVVVGFGNDQALGFYERFGFYPANFELIQKAAHQ